MNQKPMILHKIYESKEHTYYCRAANAVFPSELSFCHVCPLIGMSMKYQGYGDESETMENGRYHLTSCIYCEKYECVQKECFENGSEENESGENGCVKKQRGKTGKDEDGPEIMISAQAGLTPEQQKKLVDQSIAQGKADDFPQFSFDGKLNLVEKAFIFAAKAHRGATRKGSTIPYIVHPMETAFITAGLTDDMEIIAAAVLHDVVEDTEYTLEDIRTFFGERIAQMVASESEDKREGMAAEESWKIRKQETIDHMKQAALDTKLIALSDKLSNLRSIERGIREDGEHYWERFHQKDPKEHAWYHISLLHALDELSDTAAWKEYEQLCRSVFGSNGNV